MTRRTILFSAASFLWERPSTRWIVADITGRICEANWRDASQPACFGSLLKPFLAIAYLATHSQAPVITCSGAAAGCWYRKGHGKQDLVAALANSCNVYFLHIAEALNRAAFDLTCMSYGLAPASRSWPASRLIGLGEGWPQTPLAAVRAFGLLARNAAEPHARLVLSGMLRCSESGTAKGIGQRCYAKTGTAAPSESRDSGDGYIVAIYPVEQPRRILLFSQRHTTGADAAREAGRLLASSE
jgi:cell division protein FtsI/penicillin-binding protein 2